MKTFVLAAVAAAALSLGTVGAYADSVSGNQERAADVLAVAQSQHIPTAGSFAAATPDESVSGNQERANDALAVARSQQIPAAGHFASATTSDSVSGQQERANDLWSVIRSQPAL